MSTGVWLVRHGPTHARGMVGWTDLPADLSDNAALARLEAHLPEQAVVVSSDLIRASATADAIQGTRARLAHDPRLREFHFGEWDNREFSEISSEHPELSRAFYESPGDIRAPGGESWNDLSDRVSPAVDDLIMAHRGGHVVIVAHFGVILTQIQRALGVTPHQTLAHKISNLSVTHLTFADGWDVGHINHNP